MENVVNKQYHDKLGVAMYHLDTRFCAHKDFDYITGLGIVNATRVSMDGFASSCYACEWAKKTGAQIWLAPPTFFSSKETIEQYIEGVQKFVDKLIKAEVWDCVVGFQWDEPLLKKGHTNEDFLAMTKAMSETFKKRIFPVFSLYEVIGKRGNSGDPDFQWLFKKECSTYITDVAFDVYGYDFTNPDTEFSKKELSRIAGFYGDEINSAQDVFRLYTKKLLELMEKPDEVRVWYFPDAYICKKRTGEDRYTNEQDCINSLTALKELLLEQKNPGGLFSYTYKSWNDHDGMDWQLDKDNPQQWKNYIKAAQDVCRELSEIKIK